MALHEVWLELVSGTRVLVGSDLPDVPAANGVARRWRAIAETQRDQGPGAGQGGCRGDAVEGQPPGQLALNGISRAACAPPARP
jgi:hypothetical protein